jgi:hypothetical protein
LLHAPELLRHAGARPVDVRPFVEQRVHETHPEHRVPANGLDARRALQRADEGIGDLVFDEVRTATHPLRVDDDLRVGESRQRMEWRLTHGVGGEERERDHRAEDFDNAIDHGRYSLFAEAFAEAG